MQYQCCDARVLRDNFSGLRADVGRKDLFLSDFYFRATDSSADFVARLCPTFFGGGNLPPQNPPKMKSASEQVYLNSFRWLPDSRHRGKGKSSRDFFSKVCVNAVCVCVCFFSSFGDFGWVLGSLFLLGRGAQKILQENPQQKSKNCTTKIPDTFLQTGLATRIITVTRSAVRKEGW